MRGSLREKRPGYWQLRVYEGTDPITGRKQYRVVSLRGGKREAQRVLAQLVTDVAAGHKAAASATVGGLLDAWLAHIEHLGRSPTTLKGYRSLVDQLPKPFKELALRKVTAKLIDDLYRLLSSERKRKPATVLRFHTLLRAAFHQATRWGWVDVNPVDRATAPRVHRDSIRPPGVDEVVKVLEAAEKSKNPENAVVFRLLAATGARRGEVCALQWQDVDLDASPARLIIRRSVVDVGQLVVKGTKTHAERGVGLDAETAELLRQHQERIVELGLDAGEPPGPTDFVFERELGSGDPLPPDRLTQAWHRLCLDAGVKARLHDLRHLQASLLLDAGEAVTTVAARLGHRDTATTLKVYGHLMPGADQRAADLVGVALARSKLVSGE